MRPLLRPTWLQPTSLLARLPRCLPSRRLLTTTKPKTITKKHKLESKNTVTEKRLDTKDVLPDLQTTPARLPKIVITQGSPHHNSLPSYLEYAMRTKLEPTTSVFIGTHYEYTVALSLLRLGFSLIRTGRRSDLGIDLIGHWTLSQFRQQLPVIVQCKSRSMNGLCAPKHIRELEGAFQGMPAVWRSMDVLGLLATTERATRGVMDALGASRKPMGFVKISRAGRIEQLVWNRAAAERGLEGVGVQLRYTPRTPARPLGSDAQGVEGTGWAVGGIRNMKKDLVLSTGADTDVQLTWMGSPIFPVREDLAEETKALMRAGVDESAVNSTDLRLGRPPGSKDKTPRIRRSRSEIERAKKSSQRRWRRDHHLAAVAKALENQTGHKRSGRSKGTKDKATRKKIVSLDDYDNLSFT